MTLPAKIYRRSELEAIKPTIDSTGCLYRYRKIWIEGHDDSSDVALIGIAFHAINHAYLLKLLEANVGQDHELAEQAFVEAIATAQTPSRLIPAVRDVWLWHAETFELPLERFVAAEERGSSGDVGFTPDLVLAYPEYDALEIQDFKSGWQPPLTEVELKTHFQARVYSRYAKDRWPHFSRYQFSLIAVRFRKKVTVEFLPSDLDAVDLEVRAAIATIQEAERTGQWPATPGPSCHWCSLACPLVDQIITLPKRLLPDQVDKLAGWLLVADKQLTAAKKLLKESVKVSGPVVVNGMEWAERPVTSRSYPLAAVVDLLERRGAGGAFEGLTLSASALKKLFTTFPGLAEELADVLQQSTTYRFGVKAVSPEADKTEAE